jgi:hypothetical protein
VDCGLWIVDCGLWIVGTSFHENSSHQGSTVGVPLAWTVDAHTLPLALRSRWRQPNLGTVWVPKGYRISNSAPLVHDVQSMSGNFSPIFLSCFLQW